MFYSDMVYHKIQKNEHFLKLNDVIYFPNEISIDSYI